MQLELTEIVQMAFTKCGTDREVATYIKKEADRKYTPTWHVILGRNFASSMNYENNSLLYGYYDKTAVMIWKAG